MSITIYHNPRCSKSRQALQLLRDKGIEPVVIEYLRTPPDKNTLKNLLSMLGMGPRQLMRKKDKEYKELGLADPAVGDEKLLEAMVEHPRLLERPLVVNGEKAALGRPPEKVLDIL